MKRFLPAFVALVMASLERLGGSGPFTFTSAPLDSDPPHWGAPPSVPQGSDTGAGEDDISIRPFSIDIPHSVLDDLRARLLLEITNPRLHPPLEGVAFQYGFNSDYLKTLTGY